MALAYSVMEILVANSAYDLSDDEVHTIRMARGVAPQADTARQFGLSQSTIYLIQKGRRRGDVPFTDAELAKLRLNLVACGGRGGRGVPGRPIKS